eukprot:1755742-Pyramimonas_sp.AAC.1
MGSSRPVDSLSFILAGCGAPERRGAAPGGRSLPSAQVRCCAPTPDGRVFHHHHHKLEGGR